MNIRKILIIGVIAICIFALAYGVYYQVFQANMPDMEQKNEIIEQEPVTTVTNFEKLFDSKMHNQGYSANEKIKRNQTQELVFTSYTLNETYDEKYEINVNIPVINVRSDKITNINKEINATFHQKVNDIITKRNNHDQGDAIIYTVDYTAYLNENILSLAVRSTLKEGNNAQRIMIKAYTYNVSSDQVIPLTNMLQIRGINEASVEQKVKAEVQESIAYTNNLKELGYTVYERNINSDMYKVANSNNYLLGPNSVIYLVYAYGNDVNTSEKDIVVVE